MSGVTNAAPARSSAGDIFRAFLRLGLTSFGGPVAHLAYFREEFVRRRGWLDEGQFAQLLGLCQFLPGPASSQMGFAIGLLRGGWRGAFAAFAAFTLPSVLLMFGFAALAPQLGEDLGAALVHGLKLVAVVVVAHALVGMARQLTPDLPRAMIAVGAGALMVASGNAWLQLLAILLGALLGLWLCRRVPAPAGMAMVVGYGRRGAAAAGVLFVIGLTVALAWHAGATPSAAALAAAFYRSGALVFGGGHVVLPMLQQAVVDTGWMDADTFLAGYGAAQVMPGPMFSLAAFLGAEIPVGLPAAAGAAIALLALFAPGFLLLVAVLPVWARLTRIPSAASAMAGVNAAVVGLLAAAFLDPVLTQGLRDEWDVGIAAVGIALLLTGRIGAAGVAVGCVLASLAAHWVI